MKYNKIKQAFSMSIFMLLLLLSVAKCANLLEYKESREKYIPFYESETNFDVIFLGTSHVWNHVLSMELWDEYGIASYNWGYSNCTPAENYYLIQEILRYTSPKVVVMDVYGVIEYEEFGNGKYRTDRIEQQHIQFDSFPIWSRSKIEASLDVFDDYENNEDFIWNFIMYHNRWEDLEQSDFELDITEEKGSCFLTGLGRATYAPVDESKKVEIDSVCYPYFLNIIEYCQLRGIQVLCVYTPYAAGESQQLVANTIGDDVNQYSNCSYINMLNRNILNFDTDVCPDNVHLNYSGACKVTTWLGKYLVDNYDLDDYSTNVHWMEDYGEYYNYKENVLKEQTKLVEYLVQLSDDDFRADLEIFDENLYNSDRLQLLYSNAKIVPSYIEMETDKSAHLIVRSCYTGEIVLDAYFKCDNQDDFDIYNIYRVCD